MPLIFKSLENAYLHLLNHLVYDEPNEIGIRELFGVHFMVTDISKSNPKENFKDIVNRNINLPYQEFYADWFLSGSGDTSKLVALNKNVELYNETNGRTLLYPQRIQSQLHQIAEELKANPFSRRATLMILDAADSEIMVEKRNDPLLRKEYPCTIGITFFIRDGKLNSHVMMRSNNSVTTICYDFTNFAHLQNHVAEYLNIESDTMIYTIVNAHIEPNDFELAKLIVENN